MQVLQQVPQGWSPDKMSAYNDLVSACLAYYLFTQASGLLGINQQQAKAAVQPLSDQITTQLWPTFQNTP